MSASDIIKQENNFYDKLLSRSFKDFINKETEQYQLSYIIYLKSFHNKIYQKLLTNKGSYKFDVAYTCLSYQENPIYNPKYILVHYACVKPNDNLFIYYQIDELIKSVITFTRQSDIYTKLYFDFPEKVSKYIESINDSKLKQFHDIVKIYYKCTKYNINTNNIVFEQVTPYIYPYNYVTRIISFKKDKLKLDIIFTFEYLFDVIFKYSKEPIDIIITDQLHTLITMSPVLNRLIELEERNEQFIRLEQKYKNLKERYDYMPPNSHVGKYYLQAMQDFNKAMDLQINRSTKQ